jgi:tetratricopeptide (TPR) repeat protein
MISIFAGDYASAATDLQSAFKIALAEKNRQLEGVATAGLAKNLMYCREYTKAVARFQEALAIFEELDFPFYVAITLGELGTCYLHLGDTEKALKLFESTAEIFRAKGSLSNYQVSLADIGSVYLRRFLPLFHTTSEPWSWRGSWATRFRSLSGYEISPKRILFLEVRRWPVALRVKRRT